LETGFGKTGGEKPVYAFFSIAGDFPAMDAHAPATHIPGYSRVRLKHIIATGNIAAFAIGLWLIFFPTYLYAPALVLCILLPLLGLALDMRARGTLGFEARRRGRYPLSLATILMLPALERFTEEPEPLANKRSYDNKNRRRQIGFDASRRNTKLLAERTFGPRTHDS
jgi:hypothetical protein